MSDKEIVVNGLEWVINHKEILYKRNRDFGNNELELLIRTSLVMDRALIIHKSNKWSAIPLMLNILYDHLLVCWKYLADDEWKNLIDKIVMKLSEWKEAVESEDKESLYESMISTILCSGDVVATVMFSGKRVTTPKEWETERILDERMDRVEKYLEEIEKRLNIQEETSEFLFSRIK